MITWSFHNQADDYPETHLVGNEPQKYRVVQECLWRNGIMCEFSDKQLLPMLEHNISILMS